MAQSRKSRVKVNGNSKVRYDGRYKLDRIEIGSIEIDSSEDGDNEVKKKVQKISKSKKRLSPKRW